MKKPEFIALSAATMMLTALGIDIMLPVFGEIRLHFHLSPDSTAAAQIVTVFFLGQIAQIIFGLLSDSFGRLAILRLGFPLYIAAGIAATFAPSLNTMLAARFLAGVGASAVFTTTIAGVRDRFSGDQMAHTMSLIFTVLLSTPIVAPFLGLALLSIASWRVVFLTPPFFAVAVFLWSLRLEESLPPERRRPLDIPALTHAAKHVLGNRTFLRYTAITTALFAGLGAWVASSEHIIGVLYGRPRWFAWVFAGIGLCMAICTLTNARLSSRYGARRTLRWLLILYTAVAVILMIGTIRFGEPPPFPLFVAAVAALLGINLAIEPNSSALAMEPMGENAGLASSLYGTVFFLIGGAISSVLDHALRRSVLPLVATFLVIGILGLALASARRPRWA